MSRIDTLLSFLKQTPEDPFLYYALAQEYLKIDLEKTLYYYELLAEKFPDYEATYFHLAALYDDFDEIDKANDTYLKGIEILEKSGNEKLLAELKAAYYNFEMENL